jgi:hypothetical protein
MLGFTNQRAYDSIGGSFLCSSDRNVCPVAEKPIFGNPDSDQDVV